MKILLSRSHPSPDMPLRLVHIQDFARLSRQCGVDLEEPFGNILMYRTLTDPKLLCRLSHSSTIFYNIICNLHGSLFNIIFQKNPPANIVFTMYAERLQVMLSPSFIFSASSIYYIHSQDQAFSSL